MTPVEYAIALSHKLALRKFSETTSYEYGIVFEDDVTLHRLRGPPRRVVGRRPGVAGPSRPTLRALLPLEPERGILAHQVTGRQRNSRAVRRDGGAQRGRTGVFVSARVRRQGNAATLPHRGHVGYAQWVQGLRTVQQANGFLDRENEGERTAGLPPGAPADRPGQVVRRPVHHVPVGPLPVVRRLEQPRWQSVGRLGAFRIVETETTGQDDRPKEVCHSSKVACHGRSLFASFCCCCCCTE